MARIQEVHQRSHRAPNQLELAIQTLVALAKLEFGLEQAEEPLQLGVVPKQFGLVYDFYAPDHALLDHQQPSDPLQIVARAASDAPGPPELCRHRLDAVEIGGDTAFVMAQQDAPGQNLGDQLQARQRRKLNENHPLLQALGPRRIDAQLDLLGLGSVVAVREVRREALTQRALAKCVCRDDGRGLRGGLLAQRAS